MTNVPADVLAQGADYCARLAAVEHAHILGDYAELDLLLSSVDPIDARHVANVLRTLALSLRSGTDGTGRVALAEGGASPFPSRATSDQQVPPDGQATAPSNPVTHIGDNWSRKVMPCN